MEKSPNIMKLIVAKLKEECQEDFNGELEVK